MRNTILLAALVLLASPAVRADTIEASSTTFVQVAPDTRYRGGTKPDVVTIAPAYEILSVTARDIQTRFADDVQAVLSTWGAVDLGDRRWNAGADSHFTGDVVTGYIQGRVLDRRLTLRLGRTSVATGIARMIQIDGGTALLDLSAGPALVKLSAYAGSPTSQRFQSRSAERSWNPTGGTFAYGSRVAVALPVPGTPGRGLEVGADLNEVRDHSQAVREELGADLRLQPFARNDLAVAGFGSYSLFDRRFSEASVALSMSATRKLHLTADWRFAEPSLLLARNSILSVFSASTWNEVGAGARYDIGRGLHAGLDAHLRIEPGERSGSHAGTDLLGSVDWGAGPTTAGVELSYLDGAVNGYAGARIWARRELGRAFVTADVLGQAFRREINGQGGALTGTVGGGVTLAYGFSAVLTGSAGMTPYLEQSYQVIAKIAYNQTYRTVEVR
jgi:hypothetical protein